MWRFAYVNAPTMLRLARIFWIVVKDVGRQGGNTAGLVRHHAGNRKGGDDARSTTSDLNRFTFRQEINYENAFCIIVTIALDCRCVGAGHRRLWFNRSLRRSFGSFGPLRGGGQFAKHTADYRSVFPQLHTVSR